MTVVFVVPCYNAARNLHLLFGSLKEQTDPEWRVIFADDLSEDEGLTQLVIEDLKGKDDRVTAVFNEEKKFALRNINDVVNSHCKPDDIVAVIDGDDQLCNPETVKLLKAAYADGADVVWTAHKWDINGMNISKALPEKVNPYQYEWCSSHLRTFRASLLQNTPDSNFKDHNGNWFERGYDQALMLPILYCAKKRVYLPDVCYLYNINSVSVNDRNWAERKQLTTVNFVRARGFVDE